MHKVREHNQKETTILVKNSLVTSISPLKNFKDSIASFLGFTMGFGSISLYAPILFSLIATKTSEGFSITVISIYYLVLIFLKLLL